MSIFSKGAAPEKTAPPEWVRVGQIVGVHGVRGEVKVQVWDIDAAQFCRFATLYFGENEPFRPESRRVQGDMVLMKLPEIADRDTAETLRGRVISVRRSEVKLPRGTYFDAEIVGMQVYDYFPRRYIGTVEEVLVYPAHKLYRVRGAEKSYLIPAVEDVFIAAIDPAAREITVRMMEGLETDAN